MTVEGWYILFRINKFEIIFIVALLPKGKAQQGPYTSCPGIHGWAWGEIGSLLCLLPCSSLGSIKQQMEVHDLKQPATSLSLQGRAYPLNTHLAQPYVPSAPHVPIFTSMGLHRLNRVENSYVSWTAHLIHMEVCFTNYECHSPSCLWDSFAVST